MPIEIRSSGYAYIDFYLPKYNCFIEYNGRQHYAAVEKFGGNIQFLFQRIRDDYVRKYCSENSIILIEIPYTVHAIKDIETIIKTNLQIT